MKMPKKYPEHVDNHDFERHEDDEMRCQICGGEKRSHR